MTKINNEAEAINRMAHDWLKLIVSALLIIVGFISAVAWGIWRVL